VRSSPPIENYELLAAEHPARRRSLPATTYYVQVQPSQYIITVRVQEILLCQQHPKQVVLHPPTQNYELLTLCGRLCSTVPATRERSGDHVRVSGSGTQSTPLCHRSLAGARKFLHKTHNQCCKGRKLKN